MQILKVRKQFLYKMQREISIDDDAELAYKIQLQELESLQQYLDNRKLAIELERKDIKSNTPDTLKICVIDECGNEVYIKVKKDIKFNKLMEAYSERMNVNLENVVFLYDRDEIKPNQSPVDLNMSDGDLIDVIKKLK